LNVAVANEIRAQGGSRLDQLRALAGGGGGYGGGGYGGGGAAGFFGGGLLTTLRYSLPSLALFGAVGGLAASVKEAEELERIFNQIEVQFEALGQAGRFNEFRQEIFNIAKDSGLAADEIARIGLQLQGAFGGDTDAALQNTKEAVQAVQVTGLSLDETIDAFTALTQTYKDQNLSISDVSDGALALQERYGVLAKETIAFSADLAAVAEQAGLSVHELQALGAVSQKYSGRSGSSLAEAFGRIL